MSERIDAPAADVLPLAVWIDQLADRFEAAWKSPGFPCLADYLSGVPVERRGPLLRELLLIDLEYRRGAGQARSLNDYLHEFPELLNADGSVPDELVLHAGSLDDTSAKTIATASQPQGKSRPLPAPKVLGKFQLLELLGAGSFGSVYKARDVELDRIVAVKIPRAGSFAAPEDRERFLREAKSAANLRHAGIVPVHQVAHEGEMPYIVCEYIAGRTLADRLKFERLTFHESAQLAAQMAEALDYAHRSGVMHRDVKPSNILIDEEGNAHLTDFGLVRRFGRDVALTIEGEILGTPAYMPPEQAAGKAQDVDPRGDVYSLGVVLFELLTGRRPFEGEMAAVLNQVLHSEPPPPRRINRRIPRDLETICLKALEKLPDRRYQSAAELAEDLRRFLRDESIVARPPTPTDRAWRFVRRHPAATATCLLLAAGALAAVACWWRWPGTLSLTVIPQGAKIEVAGKTHLSPATAFELRIPPGVHRIHVLANEHTDQWHEVLVERGGVKSLNVALKHFEGVLEIDCEPRGSEIEVDGVPYGSRIRNLARPTGAYRVRASSDGYFESPTQELVLPREGVAHHRFWLDRGLVWQHTSPDIQGQLLFVPDIDGDGHPDLAHNELGRLIVFGSASGQIVWTRPLANGHLSFFDALDLGGEVGTVIVIGAEQAAGAKEAGRIVVTALRPGAKQDEVWTWLGPERPWEQPGSCSVVPAADLDGDGVLELLAAGREGVLYVINGASGKTLHEWPVEESPSVEPFGIAWRGAGKSAVALFNRYETSEAAEGELPGRSTLLAGAVEAATGRVLWRRRFTEGESKVSMLPDDSPQAFVVTWGRNWELLDDRSGETVSRGTMTSPIDRQGMVIGEDLDNDGEMELTVVPQNPSAPVECFHAAGGRRLWAGPTGRTTNIATRRERKFWRTTAGEILLLFESGVFALSPSDGRVVWRVPLRTTGLIMGDWNGDGRDELFVSVEGRGLVCLDSRGHEMWALRLGVDIAPYGVLPDLDGDGLAEIAIMRHAALLGVARGPRILWDATATGPLQATPLVLKDAAHGDALIASLGPWGRHESLACFDARTGARRWTVRENHPPNRAPALADWNGDGQTDVIGLFNPLQQDCLRAYDGASGREIASHRLDKSQAYSVPAVADFNNDGTLDFAIHRHDPRDVVAISGKDGKYLWNFATRDENYGGITTGDLNQDGRADVVAPSLDGRVYAIDGASGTLLWTAQLDAGGRGVSQVVDLTGDGVADVLAVSEVGTLHVFDGRRGEPLWTAMAGASRRSFGRPAVAQVRQSPWIVAPLGTAGVAAFDFSARREVWRAAEELGVVASPLVADLDQDGEREVVACTYDGRLLVLDLATGRQLWTVRLCEKPIEADPALLDIDQDGVLDILVADHAFHLTAVSGMSTKAARRRLSLEQNGTRP